MKIYSGKKVSISWSCLELPSGCRLWHEYITITKPMKGGHTHNHCSNRELKYIHTAKERKWLRKFLKKKLEETL